MALVTGLFAAALAATHLFVGRLRTLEALPRSAWLSAGGGVSVGYVFVHVLPELAEGGEAVRSLPGVVERHVYLVALGGFVAFYGLERFVRRSPASHRNPASGAAAPAEGAGVFWVHVGSFAVYNAVVGYLLVHRGAQGPVGLGFYAVAMGLHFVVNDHGLREHHRDRYHDAGRWVLAAAILAGWAVAIAVVVDEALVELLFAFLAGGIVLNVTKEELPAERESRFWAFAAGAAGYAALLVLA